MSINSCLIRLYSTKVYQSFSKLTKLYKLIIMNTIYLIDLKGYFFTAFRSYFSLIPDLSFSIINNSLE